MDKLGKAEITNNIYALAIQTSDGNENTFSSTDGVEISVTLCQSVWEVPTLLTAR